MSHPYSEDHPNVTAVDRGNESTPEWHDVKQEYVPSNPAVDVDCINSPVRVYQLPSRMGISRSYRSDGTIPVPLLNADDRRARARVWAMLTTSGDSATSAGIYIGSEQDVRSGDAAILPYNLILPLEHAEKVYVRAVGTVTTAVNVSLISENWAD